MYEFLAPWGVLVPAVSAGLIYVIVSGFRREKMMTMIEAPDGAPITASRCQLSEKLA